MRQSIFVLLSLSFIFLTGCASQQNVQLNDQFWQHQKQKVAVATIKAPQPQLYRTGDEGGLLGLVVNEVMTKDLEKQLEKSDLSWYSQLSTNFSQQLNRRHIYAKSYAGQINDDSKQYNTVASQVDADKVLVIKLRALGATRSYASMIPTGAPEAYCSITGELINISDQKVLWRYTATAKEAVQGEWDQPPNYPNLTNAVKVAVISAQQELIDSFFSGH